jgi:tetratricopeptide (TPR) repeat protein
VLLEDYAGAEAVGVQGLAANQGDQTLLNNLAFTLASAGKTSSAVTVYNRMRPHLLDRELAVAWLATGGLIQFRLGLPEAGRDYYRLAMELAGRIGAVGQQALACCYLAREEMLAKLPSAEDTLGEASTLADQTKWTIAKIVAARVRAGAKNSNVPLQTALIPKLPGAIDPATHGVRLKRLPAS